MRSFSLAQLTSLGLLLASCSASTLAVPDGEALWRSKYAGCHALDRHAAGPLHRDVYGRRAGSAPGYRYSSALAAATVHWDAAALDAWLRDPAAFLPGQGMYYKVPDAAERAALIEYLRSLGDQH
ncbi:MAG: c-type cytochrome [Moraxellaceae bacterium]